MPRLNNAGGGANDEGISNECTIQSVSHSSGCHTINNQCSMDLQYKWQ